LRVLKNQQKKTGMSISTLIRRAVTEFIDALTRWRGESKGAHMTKKPGVGTAVVSKPRKLRS
jgi:hypothetical protein